MHFCQKPASCLVTYGGVRRGAQFPGRQIIVGNRIAVGGAE